MGVMSSFATAAMYRILLPVTQPTILFGICPRCVESLSQAQLMPGFLFSSPGYRGIMRASMKKDIS
jgi:hypothetical protein